jgi:uncharacterized protein (UPF0332 family)
MSLIDDLLSKGKLKKAVFTKDMCQKEYNIGLKDLDSAKKSYEDGNYKWATIQAYYAIFHATRALLYIVPKSAYSALERGMNLREMADYKENYSQKSAAYLIEEVISAIEEIQKVL